MLYLAGIIITIFLTVLLAGKKNKTVADVVLILWFCVMAFHLSLFYLFISGRIYNYPDLLGIGIPLPLLHGPFLFLYTAALTRQPRKGRITWLIHFLPALLAYLALVPYFSLTNAEKINVYQHKGAGYENFLNITLIAIIVSGIAYVAASLILLRRYRHSIKDKFSNIEKINLVWLRTLIYGIAVVWIAVIFTNDQLTFGTVVLFVFFLGFFGVRQTGIFTAIQPPTGRPPSQPIEEMQIEPVTRDQQEVSVDEKSVGGDSTKIKYEKSGLSEDQGRRIYEQLATAMRDQKLFTETELTLAGLAKILDVHPNHLSQVINSYEGKNFYDYINFHRVEEFRRLAPQPDNRNYTLLSMAYECGFNSKTSFNRNFKKVTGISPTEYLSRQHISLK